MLIPNKRFWKKRVRLTINISIWNWQLQLPHARCRTQRSHVKVWVIRPYFFFSSYQLLLVCWHKSDSTDCFLMTLMLLGCIQGGLIYFWMLEMGSDSNSAQDQIFFLVPDEPRPIFNGSCWLLIACNILFINLLFCGRRFGQFDVACGLCVQKNQFLLSFSKFLQNNISEYHLFHKYFNAH